MSEEIKDIEKLSSIVSEPVAEIAYDSQTVEVSAAELGVSDSRDPGIDPYSIGADGYLKASRVRTSIRYLCFLIRGAVFLRT